VVKKLVESVRRARIWRPARATESVLMVEKMKGVAKGGGEGREVVCAGNSPKSP